MASSRMVVVWGTIIPMLTPKVGTSHLEWKPCTAHLETDKKKLTTTLKGTCNVKKRKNTRTGAVTSIFESPVLQPKP